MRSSSVEITWLLRPEHRMIVSGEKLYAYDIISQVSSHSRVCSDDFYLVQNGRLLDRESEITDGLPVRAQLRILGGKGGFGSMLRAIGAQIEKTTNREACRDLSGRRLRDINEEKRLKTWIGQQADRERQEAERKQRKLEKLRAEPKHEFSDKEYEERRSQLVDKVHDAVEHGFSSLTPSSPEPSTSKATDHKKPAQKKRKKKGFMFEDEELSLSESELEEESPEQDSSSKKRALESTEDNDCSPSKKQKTVVSVSSTMESPAPEEGSAPVKG